MTLKPAEALFRKNSPEGNRWYTKDRALLQEQDDGVEALRRSIDYYGRTGRLSQSSR